MVNPRPDPEGEPHQSDAHRRVSYEIGNRHSSTTLRWILLPTAAVLLLGLVAVLAGPRLYREVRSVRAARMAASSREAWNRGEWEAAWRSLQLALALDRSQPEAARLAAEWLGRFGSPTALDHWAVVTQGTSATKADHLAHFDAALALSRADVATRVLKDIAARYPGDDAVTERQIALALRTGHHAEAARLSRAALDANPTGPRWELGLGDALLRSGTPREVSDGRRILMSIALGNGPHKVAAVELLASHARLTAPERQVLLRALEGVASTDASFVRLTTGLRLGAATQPEERAAIVAGMVGAASALEPAGRVLLGAFALDAGFPATALKLVPADLAQQFAPAAPVHLVALTADPRSTNALRILATETNSPLSAPLRGAAAAARAHREGDRTLSLRLIAQAIADGARSGDPVTDLTTVGRVAEGMGETDSAIAAYEALLEHPPAVPAAAAALTRLLPATGDYPRRFRLLSRLHQFMPGNREVGAEYAYLALVMGDNAREATAVFQGLHDANPADRTGRAGLALSLALSGEGERALEMAEAGRIRFEELGLRERFIQVLCLAVACNRSAAQNLARGIPVASLQPEEQALLVRHLGQE